MKNKSRILYLAPVLVVLFALVAWSPPNSENLIVGPTSGTGDNKLSAPGGQSGLVGASNEIRGTNTFVVGESNINYNSDHTANTANKISRSLVVGLGNMPSGDRANCILAGSANAMNANNTLVSGANNDLASVTSTEVRNSCAIGANNIVTSPHAYAVGYNNTVSGDYGVTVGHSNLASASYSQSLGYGLKSTQLWSVAVGKYNNNMSSGDIFVVGTGTSDTARFTAIRVTNDGGVILGRSQGDISMGAYSN